MNNHRMKETSQGRQSAQGVDQLIHILGTTSCTLEKILSLTFEIMRTSRTSHLDILSAL